MLPAECTQRVEISSDCIYLEIVRVYVGIGVSSVGWLSVGSVYLKLVEVREFEELPAAVAWAAILWLAIVRICA
jgi:hypothetical protein